jgi:hypothetical protein
MKKIFFILLAYFFILPSGIFAQTLQRPVQVQNVTTTSADIIWKSSTGGTSQVKFGTTTGYERGTVNGSVGRKQIDNSPGFLHKVTLTGLAPNSKYFYQVLTNGTALSPAGDQSFYIKTSPAYGSTTPFSWVAIGDSGNASSAQKGVATQIANRKPELVIEAGDVAYGAGYGGFANLSGEPEQDRVHFDIFAESMKFSPYYLACGNHDNNDNNTPAGIKNGCAVMVDDQAMPNGGKIPQATGAYDNAIYSFNYGNVHFTVLNTNPESSPKYTSPTNASAQMLWAYNDIKNAPSNMWKVVIWHTNGWSAGSHATNTNMTNGPILMVQDAGAHVVIWGHSHAYERFGRYANQGRAGCTTPGGCRDKGPYYFTIGNSGSGKGASACGSYTNGPQCLGASGIGANSSLTGLLYVQTNGNNMTFNYIGSTGTQHESVTYNLASLGTVITSGRVISPEIGAPSPTRTRTPTRIPTSGGPSATRTRTPTRIPNQSGITVVPTQPQGDVCNYFKN